MLILALENILIKCCGTENHPLSAMDVISSAIFLEKTWRIVY